MTDSETLQAAVAVLRKQEAKGRAKYGADLDSFGSVVGMASHAKEEAADTLMYLVTLERLVAKLEAENAALKARVARLEAQGKELPKGVWIEHTGGECPVPGDTIVRIMHHDDVEWVSTYEFAEDWGWGPVSRYMIEPDGDA